MSFSCLNDWLAWLETLHPRSIDLGLHRISPVANTLHLLPFPAFVITVTGTNGKGSCVTLLESMLLAAGYRVGAYTSPHLLRYNERLRIQGQIMEDDNLCHAFHQVNTARGNTSLTYFEFGTLAALWLLKQAALDVVILEVGLGGRLDAVNVVDPDIAVISTIAIDHSEWLGEDREVIGREKAGIFRLHKPAVCGDFHVPQSVRVYAEQLAVPLYCQGRHFGYVVDETSWSWWGGCCYLANLPKPQLPIQNAATVLKVVELLASRFFISRAVLESVLQHTQMLGRFQTLHCEGKSVILDVAHNPAAALWLSERLRATYNAGKTHVVWAMLSDKDIVGTAQAMLCVASTWHVAGLTISRGASAEQLMDCLQCLGIQEKYAYTDVPTAYRAALATASAGDRVVVFGSFYTVAQVLDLKVNK